MKGYHRADLDVNITVHKQIKQLDRGCSFCERSSVK